MRYIHNRSKEQTLFRKAILSSEDNPFPHFSQPCYFQMQIQRKRSHVSEDTRQRLNRDNLKVAVTPAFQRHVIQSSLNTSIVLNLKHTSNNVFQKNMCSDVQWSGVMFARSLFYTTCHLQTEGVAVQTCPWFLTRSPVVVHFCNRHRQGVYNKHWQGMIRFVSL